MLHLNSVVWQTHLVDPALDLPYQEELFGEYDIGHFTDNDLKLALAKFLSITWGIDVGDADVELTCYHSMKYGPDVYRSNAYSTYVRTVASFRSYD